MKLGEDELSERKKNIWVWNKEPRVRPCRKKVNYFAHGRKRGVHYISMTEHAQ